MPPATHLPRTGHLCSPPGISRSAGRSPPAPSEGFVSLSRSSTSTCGRPGSVSAHGLSQRQPSPDVSVPAPATGVLCGDRRRHIAGRAAAMLAGSEAADLRMDNEGVVSEEAAQEVVFDALTWAALHGLVVGDRESNRSGTVPGVGMVHAPVTLLPSPFPREMFQRAVQLAPLFNELADRVSLDADFLQQTLARAAKTDAFTRGLLDIHAKISEEGIPQDVRLGMHRSDYMLDMSTGGILQIELNTISSSFAGLSSLVSDLHRFVIGRMEGRAGLEEGRVPPNSAAADMAEALALGWKQYGSSSAVVLAVVQAPERNMYDQLWLAHRLWSRHRVRTVRATLARVREAARADGADRTLRIDGEEVAVVYFRAGYGPADYPSEVEWEARLLLERSRAIKCPNIAYHLAGAKKVQQELATPGVLERFVDDRAAAAALRSCFSGLWSLEGPGGEEAVAEAIAHPERFVLKPQREGGGNNIYGEEVRSKVEELRAAGDGGDGLAAYILMQRIFPPIHKAYLLRAGECSLLDTLSELGIYGTYLRARDKVVLNKSAGHLLRTKTATSDEGGVAAGFAVLDSPYLT